MIEVFQVVHSSKIVCGLQAHSEALASYFQVRLLQLEFSARCSGMEALLKVKLGDTIHSKVQRGLMQPLKQGRGDPPATSDPTLTHGMQSFVHLLGAHTPSNHSSFQ